MSYEHGFAKKQDCHKHFAHEDFRSVFHAPSQKFKILTIPNVLGHGKSYEHSLAKKRYGHKLCTKLTFNQFFVYHLENSKFKPFPTYLPLGSRTSLVS
ncbi:hypothetical protein BHE74_00009483 [Ensete ventricosum]|nr:hypothetical protein BHE74_00009483 [Ensete ventricosum]